MDSFIVLTYLFTTIALLKYHNRILLTHWFKKDFKIEFAITREVQNKFMAVLRRFNLSIMRILHKGVSTRLHRPELLDTGTLGETCRPISRNEQMFLNELWAGLQYQKLAAFIHNRIYQFETTTLILNIHSGYASYFCMNEHQSVSIFCN